jgi:hypothetical protein
LLGYNRLWLISNGHGGISECSRDITPHKLATHFLILLNTKSYHCISLSLLRCITDTDTILLDTTAFALRLSAIGMNADLGADIAWDQSGYSTAVKSGTSLLLTTGPLEDVLQLLRTPPA